MRGRGSEIGAQVKMGICIQHGCNACTFDDELCPSCRSEVEWLDEVWGREQADRARARQERNTNYSELAKKYAERVRNFAWFVLFVAMMSAIGYYVWPWVWAVFELWFGDGGL